MKVYVVELVSDIHNCNYDISEPMVFAKKEYANKYANSLFTIYYSLYKDDIKELDKTCGWLVKPDDKDGSWSFNTYIDDMVKCDVYEKEVK